MTDTQISLLNPVYVRRWRVSWETNCLKVLGQKLYNETRGLPEDWEGVEPEACAK